MTNGTSSSSANGTTEAPKPDQTGRQPIEKNSERTWTPEDLNAMIKDFLERYGTQGEEPMTDWDFFWWSLRVTVVHWFGHHTLIPQETWEKGTDRRVRIIKTGMKCWKCEYREP